MNLIDKREYTQPSINNKKINYPTPYTIPAKCINEDGEVDIDKGIKSRVYRVRGEFSHYTQKCIYKHRPDFTYWCWHKHVYVFKKGHRKTYVTPIYFYKAGRKIHIQFLYEQYWW